LDFNISLSLKPAHTAVKAYYETLHQFGQLHIDHEGAVRSAFQPWALEQFRSHYADPSITKWDIFHYVYAVIHHPEYRHRYAANLRRELPRIPFIGAAHLTDVIPNRREAAVRNLLLQR
jgi:predicted helicase